MRILYCASEAVPFAKTGGLADVAGALPKALAALGHDVRLALPKYSAVPQDLICSQPLIKDLPIPLGADEEKVSLWESHSLEEVTTYLVGCDALFDRPSLYGQPDDARRFTFFNRALAELMVQLEWHPEIIHCNDWQTALLPLYAEYIMTDKSAYQGIGTVYSIHNLAYQGVFGKEALQEAGLDDSFFTPEKLEFYGQVNFMKAGILGADVITTVSETYAEEIQTPEYGERLEGLLKNRKDVLFGIVNGLDYDIWDPSKDTKLTAQYNARSLEDKLLDKKALQRHVGLPEWDVPLIGVISRLAAQKGFDILADIMPHLLRLEVQFVLLGTGEERFHDLFTQLAQRSPEKVSVRLRFDDTLAHQIYAGADIFLMPSRYEPCGLGQLISMRYGTIPIVRATGGLADTVQPYDAATGHGTGFRFEEYSPVALLGAIAEALSVYQYRESWRQLMRQAMSCDFSWARSASRYVEVYEKARALSRSPVS